MKKINNKNKVDKILDIYGLNNRDRMNFLEIITHIYNHKEFQKKMTQEFLHHGDVTLGEHIIEDAVVTYLMSRDYLKKHQDLTFDINIAVTIAMLHDLYTVPWQNNNEAKTYKFFNKHGFRHPIEAVINAAYWYPILFEDLHAAEKIIDGIAHHMFPFPVAVLKNSEKNLLELKNFELLDKIPVHVKRILIKTTNRRKIGKISFSHSLYKEGRIMAKADKYVSTRQIKDISSAMALLTGHNKKILKK